MAEELLNPPLINDPYNLLGSFNGLFNRVNGYNKNLANLGNQVLSNLPTFSTSKSNIPSMEGLVIKNPSYTPWSGGVQQAQTAAQTVPVNTVGTSTLAKNYSVDPTTGMMYSRFTGQNDVPIPRNMQEYFNLTPEQQQAFKNYLNNNQSSSMSIGDWLGGIGSLIGAGAKLFSAFGTYGLAKQQMRQADRIAHLNYDAQRQMVEENRRRASGVGLALAGRRDTASLNRAEKENKENAMREWK